jgi:YVTN family beta-propeller protein
MLLTSITRSRTFSLTSICLWLLFAGSAINTIHAQARAYVTDRCNNSVFVIDTGTNKVVDTIPVGITPFVPAVTPDGTRVYVTHRDARMISVIDTATDKVISTIPLAGFAWGIAITPDGTRAYVPTVSSLVSVIDTSTNTVTATIPVSFSPFNVAITPDGAKVYVTHALTLDSPRLSVISTATNSVIHSFRIAGDPTGIAITPDGTRAFVTSQTFFGGEIIDTATDSLVDFGPLGYQIAITPDGTRAYVGRGTEVSSIDTATNTVAGTVQISGLSRFLAATADSKRVYVCSQGDLGPDSSVAVIDTATNMVVDEIPGMTCPNGIAIAPPQFPRSKDDCKGLGYQQFGPPAFRNQGQCVRYVNEHAK